MFNSFRKDVEKCNFTRYHFSKQTVWFPFQVLRFDAVVLFSLFQCHIAIETSHTIPNSGVKESILNQICWFLSHLLMPVCEGLFPVYVVHFRWMHRLKRK